MIVIKPRGRFQRSRIRSTARFGQAIGCNLVHTDQVRQETGLQFGTAKAVDHPCRHIVDRNKGACRRTAIGHRLHYERGFEPAKSCTTRFFGDINGPKAKLTGGLPDIDRIMALLVPFRRKGRNGICREFARHILNGNLIFVKVKLVLHGGAVAPRI